MYCTFTSSDVEKSSPNLKLFRFLPYSPHSLFDLLACIYNGDEMQTCCMVDAVTSVIKDIILTLLHSRLESKNIYNLNGKVRLKNK